MPLDQFAVFFLFLITGFFLKKHGVFNDAVINAINKFLLLLAIPCLILARTTALEMNHRIFVNFMLAMIISFGLLMLFGAYARLYCSGRRFEGEDRPVIEFAIMSSNNGYMGFPVTLTFFGGLGLLYMVGCNTALNLSFFTYGVALMNRGRGAPGETAAEKLLKLIRMICNPIIIATFAGIILCYNQVGLPGVLSLYLDGVGGLATPLAMISIGTTLAGGFGLRSIKKRAVVETVLNKLFIVPCIAFAIVRFLPVDPFVKTILIVANVLPVATTVPIFAEQYGRDKRLAGESLVISTVLSMVTIPTAIWLLNHIGW